MECRGSGGRKIKLTASVTIQMSGGMLPKGKKWNLRTSNCWKCVELSESYHLIILYHFKSLTIHQAGLFGSWGCTCTPHAPCLQKTQFVLIICCWPFQTAVSDGLCCGHSGFCSALRHTAEDSIWIRRKHPLRHAYRHFLVSWHLYQLQYLY